MAIVDYNKTMPYPCKLDENGNETNKRMSFVQMAMFIDAHNDLKGASEEYFCRLFYSLSLMHAAKRKYFKTFYDYDGFAIYMAQYL